MGEGAIIMRCVGCDKGLVIFILVRGFEFYLLEEASKPNRFFPFSPNCPPFVSLGDDSPLSVKPS